MHPIVHYYGTKLTGEGYTVPRTKPEVVASSELYTQSQIMSKLLLLDMASNDQEVGRCLVIGLGLGYDAQHRRQHVCRIVSQSALRADIPYQATFGIYDKAVTLLQRKYSVS